MKTVSMQVVLTIATVLGFQTAQAEDLLVKIANPVSTKHAAQYFSTKGLKSEAVSDQWIRVQGSTSSTLMKSFLESGSVVHVQKNYKLNVFKNPSLQQAAERAIAQGYSPSMKVMAPAAGRDNPAIPAEPTQTEGADPLFNKQWGMIDIGVQNAWKMAPDSNKMIVAVIDTGVDYTHEDLLPNMWRNTSEIADNGIDDDGNGYIDDIVGWDFLSNDNKPYDLAATSLGDILNGGNPGHGTHCAGNVAARGGNAKGVSGVAPQAKIMALRFIGDEGGTTAGAIGAIRYAVDNGAKVLSNSWGSEGEDPNEAEDNLALREAIQYAADNDVLFVAAAGNSSRNNDTDEKKAFPASYPHENIVAVAAIDVADKIASFSNYGATNVDIGAPGVKIFSTTVDNKYSDTVIPLLGANWDGTSMACPHVAGAAALYWSAHPDLTYAEVKAALLNSAEKITSLNGKVLTGGKLNVEALMNQ